MRLWAYVHFSTCLRHSEHQEIESILEFLYLGETTLSQSRMDEFLKVATNLEITEISKDLNMDLDDMDDLDGYGVKSRTY